MAIRMLAPLAAAIVLAAAAAGPARAAELTPFPHGTLHSESFRSAGVHSDGYRYFVWQQGRWLYRVYDDRADQVHDVPVPEGCSLRDVTVNLALFHCEGGGSLNPHLLFLRSRAFVPARRRDDLAGHGYGTIGRHWIGGGFTSPTTGKPVNAYLNWRTGELRQEHPDFGPARDLDDPGLPPLRTGGSFLFDREPPFVARTLPQRSDEPRPLVLDAPRRPRVRLSPCARRCVRMDMSARLVTWAENEGTAGAYDVTARRRYLWRFADLVLAPTVVHTREHVLIGPPPQNPSSPGLLWARLRK